MEIFQRGEIMKKIENMVGSYYKEIFKTGLTIPNQKVTESKTMTQILDRELIKVKEEVTRRLQKYFDDMIPPYEGYESKREYFNVIKYELMRDYLKDELSKNPELYHLVKNKMIKIERTYGDVTVFFLPYQAFLDLDNKDILRNIDIIKTTAAFQFKGSKRGRNPMVNHLMLKHYETVLSFIDHPVTAKILEVKGLREDIQQAIEFIQKAYSPTKGMKQYTGEGELHRNGLLVTRVDAAKLATAMKLFIYMDFMYKAERTIGEIIVDMVRTSQNLDVSRGMGELDIEALKQLAGTIQQNGFSASTAVVFRLDIPTINNNEDPVKVKIRRTTGTFGGEGEYSQKVLESFFDTKIMMPNTLFGREGQRVRDFLETPIVVELVKAMSEWDWVEKRVNGMGDELSMMREVTKVEKMGIFSRWINAFAGKGIEK